ncbi:MAG: DegV family protein [Oscillospiraceae bacterium]|nr:DegV family protein [Oscillospiraceae bacterium]
MDYVLITDSSCDIPDSLAKEYNVDVLPMEYQMEGKSYKYYLDAREMSLDEFYTKLKSGINATTSQINYDSYFNYFEPYLKEGKDILYVCISLGLSGSYNTCKIAVKDLQEKYPNRKIYIIDPCCDSAGQGFLVYMAAQKYKEGYTIEQLRDYIEENKLKICHFFVVDDLDQLKRGGRISAVTATFGKALQIKPMLSVDENSKLVTIGKIRGTNKVYDEFVKKIKRDCVDIKNQTVVVAHADNAEGANKLAEMLKPLVKEVMIFKIGPVIGAHVGSGMIALLFNGNRNTTM